MPLVRRAVSRVGAGRGWGWAGDEPVSAARWGWSIHRVLALVRMRVVSSWIWL